MATVTLAESAKLSQDMLVAGVIENIVDVDPIYHALPFSGIEGNAVSFNRENALGDTQVLGVGANITATNAATFTKVTAELTTIIGQAQVNGLIEATRSNYVGQKAVQVASKAKSAGRQFQQMFVNGTGANDQFLGLSGLVASSQIVDAGTDGAALSFDELDLLLDQVKDKDGKVDFMLMSRRTHRSLRKLLRSANGNTAGDIVTLPSGVQIMQYCGVSVYASDFMSTSETHGASTSSSSIYAGTFDDGSMTHGIAGLTASKQSGIKVKEIGDSHIRDESLTNVVWYVGLANYSEKGLACLRGVTN
jgi:HK97 family phage major capsid protein